MANGDAAGAAGMDVVPSTAKLGLGYDEINKTRDYILEYGMPDLVPVDKGGTGATTPSQARTNLGINWANLPGKPSTFPPSPHQPAAHTHVAKDVGGGGDFGGDASTVYGFPGSLFLGRDLFVPSSYQAQSGYTVAYINTDGRLSRGASSERFKTGIVRDPELPDLFVVPLAEFTMRDDPAGERHYGHIAEDLAGNPDTARFVVYDEEGLPFSFDMIGFLFAKVEQLHREIRDLRERG